MKPKIIKISKKEVILNSLNRTMVKQKPKIESNKKIYSRKNYKAVW